MFKTESYRKGIIYSVFFNFIARGIAFLNALVVAFYFGNNSTTDLYFYILSFVTIITSFINGMDTYVLIPESLRLRHQESDKSAMRFLNFFLYLYVLLGVIIALIIVANPVGFYDLISKFGDQQLNDNVSLLYLSILLIMLMLITNLQVSIFASHRYFTMPMLVSVANNILSFVMIIVLHKQYGLKAGMLGMIGGYFLNMCFLAYYMKRKLQWSFSLKRTPITKSLKRNLLFLQASNIFLYLRNYANVYLLSGLPAGTVTSYNYGQQLSSIPESMVTTQFGSVAGIKMSELYAKRLYEDLNRIFVQVCRVLLFLLFPLSGLMFCYSYEIVHFLYGRGRFDQAAVMDVARFLKYLALLLPMSVLMSMAGRVFTAFQKVGLAFYYNVLINIFLILLIAVGVHFYGVMGYLVAYIAGYLIVLFALYFLLKYNIREIEYFDILLFFFKMLLIHGAIVAIIYLVKYAVAPLHLHDVLSGLLGGVCYFILLFIISSIFGLRSFFNKKTYLTG
jgi:putative peptidoglycan lipid II flippase